MADSFSIGKIFGIDIELHWTFLLLMLIFLLLSVFGSFTIFILIVLLFGCVLLHEISHSIAALRNGVKVSRIVLLPIGGISVIEDLSLDSSVEFNITAAGPMMSLLLGGIFGMLVVFTPPGIFTFLFQEMFLINILLGALNLIPAFPMDGGRLLRSYLQRKRSSYDATMLAVRVSGYALSIIVLGTVLFFVFATQDSFAYRETTLIWNLFVVFFLYGGMEAEKENTIIKKRTAGLGLEGAVSRNFVLMDPETGIDTLYKDVGRIGDKHIITRYEGSYSLVELSDRRRILSASRVSDIVEKIPNIDAKINVVDAMAKLESGGRGIGAVTKHGRIIGVVTLRQLQSYISLYMVKKMHRSASE